MQFRDDDTAECIRDGGIRRLSNVSRYRIRYSSLTVTRLCVLTVRSRQLIMTHGRTEHGQNQKNSVRSNLESTDSFRFS